MNQTSLKRNTALDLVRCVAFFFVVWTHFFQGAEYNSGPIRGMLLYGMGMLRALSSTCVPLFILLSGYLMHDRKISRSYYRKLPKTLVIYVLASAACVAYRNLADRDPLTFQQTVRGILDFTAAPYSWYIEMYIGLFLMIPFLNVLYQNLEARAHKQLLLAVLLFSTALPSIGNIWCFMELEWWLDPTIPVALYKLVPQWWENLYPLTYYFLGCYLREYPLKWKFSAKLGLLAAVTLLFGTYCYYRSYNTWFIFGLWTTYGSADVALLAVLLFSLLAELPMKKLSDGARRWLARCSDWSLGAYLVSWIFDDAFYRQLNARIPAIPDRMVWFPVMVLLVSICAMSLSAILTTLTTQLLKAVSRK